LAFKEIGQPQNQLMIHADSIVHAASTMKTPVMVEIFNQIEQKKWKTLQPRGLRSIPSL
jgi:beta-lactamase class A